MNKIIIILGLILALISSGIAQTNFQEKRRAFIDSASLRQPLLDMGKVYGYFYPRAEGKHYIGSADEEGQFTYDGILYQGVTVNYDLYNQLIFLALEVNDARIFILPDQQRISTFSFKGMQYARYDESPYPGMEAGIYERYYNSGELTLLIRRKKDMAKSGSSIPGSKAFKFVNANRHYLIRNGEAIRFKNKKEFIAASAKPEKVKGYIKSNKIKLNPRQDDFIEKIKTILAHTSG